MFFLSLMYLTCTLRGLEIKCNKNKSAYLVRHFFACFIFMLYMHILRLKNTSHLYLVLYLVFCLMCSHMYILLYLV